MVHRIEVQIIIAEHDQLIFFIVIFEQKYNTHAVNFCFLQGTSRKGKFPVD